MKTDIETREDIDALMRVFYTNALGDERIGYIFTDVAKLDLDAHLPVIGDFWESVILGRNLYQRHGRNPLRVHGELNKKTPLRAGHFGRWLEIFAATVDEMFAGVRADFMKQRAGAIANRMIDFTREPGPDTSDTTNPGTSVKTPVL